MFDPTFTRREAIACAGAVFGLSASSLGRASSSAKTSVRANAKAYFAPLVERSDYSGYVLLERDGTVLLSRGFGYADDAARTPHTPDTHYATASVGKMFTRAAALALARAGKLSPSDPISRFLPNFPGAGGITIQNLIEHKSGLSRDLPPDTDLTKPRTLEELVMMVAAAPAEAKPGERFAYSNNGYRTLARIIELAGQGPYDDLVRETVFEPRGMRSTIPNIGQGLARATAGHLPGPGWRSRRKAPFIDMSNQRGAGSFLVTPNDMLRFLKTLPLERRDLDEAARTDGQGRPKPRSVGHDGFGDGYANLAYAYPDERAYMVSLSNMQTGVFEPMHGDLRRLLFGEQVATPSVPAPVAADDASNWDVFVGDYDLRPGNPVRVRRQAGQLTVDAGDAGHPLIPLGNGKYFMRLRYATLQFTDIKDGKAQLLRWAEGGGEFPLKRLD